MVHHPSHAWIAVLDLVDYSSHSDPLQASMVDALDELVRAAVADAGLNWNDLEIKDRGDGMILKLPADVPPVRIVGDLIRTLDRGLAQSARIHTAEHRMRLRVSLHQGLTDGFAGQAVNFACHLVDSDLLRETVRRAPAATLALIVSDAFYREVIKPGHRLIDPATYACAVLDVKNEPGSTVWLYVPGYASPPLPPGTPTPPAPRSGSLQDDGDDEPQDGDGRAPTRSGRRRAPAGAPDAGPQHVTNHIGGDYVDGDKISYGKTTYHQSFGTPT